MNQKGSIYLIIIISILVLLLLVSLGWWYINISTRSQQTLINSQEGKLLMNDTANPSPSESEEPAYLDYQGVKEEYGLNEKQLEILSRVDRSTL